MSFIKYHYPTNTKDTEYKELAHTMYLKCVNFRSKQSNIYGKYNVAVFCVTIGKDITGYVISRSIYDTNEHSEDHIVKELRESGIEHSQIVAVFSEWAPCVKERRIDTPIPMGKNIVYSYQPHPCRIMLDNILNDDTPVFYGNGPVL